MHSLSASFILGYHGCDRETGERLLQNEAFEPSENNYDWLGPGIYFWEANPDRALAWAKEKIERQSVQDGSAIEPFVVGAVIEPGYCLDLISSNGISAVKNSYKELVALLGESGVPVPENKGGDDLFLRKLDCAVIKYLHQSRAKQGEPAFETVRGVFTEGEQIYPNAGFRAKTHIQMCVIKPTMIKGVFRVPESHFTGL